jgi:hypothetical protein
MGIKTPPLVDHEIGMNYPVFESLWFGLHESSWSRRGGITAAFETIGVDKGF